MFSSQHRPSGRRVLFLPGLMGPCLTCPHRRRGVLAHRVLVVLTAAQVILLALGWASLTFGEESPSVAVLTHRMAAIEVRVQHMEGEHRTLGYMLLGTLASSVGALATYIIKAPRREPSWDGVTERRRPPNGGDRG